MYFFNPLIVASTVMFLIVCALLFYLIWYGYKSRKTVESIFISLEEILSRNALKISAEIGSNIINKFIEVEFDDSYYIRQLKVLFLNDRSGVAIRVTAVSDISIPFTITMKQKRVIIPSTKLSRDNLQTFFRDTFMIDCNNIDLYERYFYKENIIALLRNIGIFSKLQINSVKGNNNSTIFEIYVKKIALSSILSAVALFESLLRSISMETRYRIITNSLKNSLIPQSELV